jgi:hypothetical protein
MRKKARFVLIGGICLLMARVAFGPDQLHVGVQDYWGTPPAGVSEIASALGLQIDGQVTGLFASESLMATLGPNGAGKTTLLGGHGFAAGDKVRIANAGGGKLTIERLGGTPLTIHVHMDEYWRPEVVEEMTSALGLQIEGKAAGLFTKQSLTAVIGTGSTMLFDKGYLKGNRVKVTNAGGGKLTIERMSGSPVTIHIKMDEYY